MRKLILMLAGVLVFAATGAQEMISAGEAVTLGGVDCRIWEAAMPTSVTKPIFVMSHHFHGNNAKYGYLMEAMAKMGFVAVAPNHADAVYAGSLAKSEDAPEEDWGSAEKWTAETFRGRAEDIKKLLKGIDDDEMLGARVDFARVVLAGHSVGGYTVLSMAGAQESWKVAGVKAVVAISPHTSPLLLWETLGKVDVPVLYMTAKDDFFRAEILGGAYPSSGEPRYLVDFAQGDHFLWSDGADKKQRADIVGYTSAFVEAYLALGSTSELQKRRESTNFVWWSDLGGKSEEGLDEAAGNYLRARRDEVKAEAMEKAKGE